MPFYNTILTLDVAAYGIGDVLADTQLVVLNPRKSDKELILDSIKVVDKDDVGTAIDLIFLKSNTSIGTENGVPNISDANVAAAVIGHYALVAADFIDYGGAKVAHKINLNMPLELAQGDPLYIAAIARAASTYTALGIEVELGIRPR